MENQLNELEDYYERLPESVRELFLFLRRFLLDLDPKIEEYYKYRLPFFHYDGKPLCYFNYSKNTPPYCYLSFAQLGFKEVANHPALKEMGRKSVRIYPLDPNQDIDTETIKSIVYSIIIKQD